MNSKYSGWQDKKTCPSLSYKIRSYSEDIWWTHREKLFLYELELLKVHLLSPSTDYTEIVMLVIDMQHPSRAGWSENAWASAQTHLLIQYALAESQKNAGE